jgi:hypothetical protein
MEPLSHEDWKSKLALKKEEALRILAADLASEGITRPDTNYVASDAQFPCLYTSRLDEAYTYYYGNKKIPTRPLPADFHWKHKPGIRTIHVSSVGCPFLEVGMEVDCFAEIYYRKLESEYYHTTHPVGSCPWKTCSNNEQTQIGETKK